MNTRDLIMKFGIISTDRHWSERHRSGVSKTSPHRSIYVEFYPKGTHHPNINDAIHECQITARNNWFHKNSATGCNYVLDVQ